MLEDFDIQMYKILNLICYFVFVFSAFSNNLPRLGLMSAKTASFDSLGGVRGRCRF